MQAQSTKHYFTNFYIFIAFEYSFIALYHFLANFNGLAGFWKKPEIQDGRNFES